MLNKFMNLQGTTQPCNPCYRSLFIRNDGKCSVFLKQSITGVYTDISFKINAMKPSKQLRAHFLFVPEE